MIKICNQCQKKFEISEAEMQFYKEKGLDYPQYCVACRKARRRTYDAVVPKGKERRRNRRAILKSVPAPFLTFFVIVSFVLLSIVRGGSGNEGATPQDNGQSSYSNVQEAFLFRSDKLLNDHYEKHGIEMGYSSAEQYLAGANATINHSDVLHKTQKEDGDEVYYVESTNDFVVVSKDGYIRTYFRPNEGLEYFERQ